MLSLFMTAFGLGFAYNAAPGAVNTESLKRGLSRGCRACLRVQLGALIGHLAWAIVGLTGTSLIIHMYSARLLLAFAGALFLLRLAWLSYLDSKRVKIEPEASGTGKRDFATGIFFSIANPFGIAFWVGIGGGLLPAIAQGQFELAIAVFLVGFTMGAVGWCAVISALIGWAQNLVNEKLLKGVYTLSSLALVYFALEMLYSSWVSIIRPLLLERAALKN